MQNNQLPDTPWHIGCVKKEESDPRRHKSRCIYLQGGICKQGKLRCFGQRCLGSSHCKYYAESEQMAQNVYLKTRSVEEEFEDKKTERLLKGQISGSETISYTKSKTSSKNKLVFTGVESLHITEIHLPSKYDNMIPSEKDIQAMMDYYNQHRKIDKPIIVEVRDGKYYLKDNYLQYYISKKIGKKWIKATIDNKFPKVKKKRKPSRYNRIIHQHDRREK